MLVWDDELEVAVDEVPPEDIHGPLSASTQFSVSSVPLPRRMRSLSAAGDFPPPMRRTSTEAPRPVPFSAKFQRVHPGTTGVTVLEHLERLDAVEASLKRLGVDDSVIEEEDEEIDVGESSQRKPAKAPQTVQGEPGMSPRLLSSQFSPNRPPDSLPAVAEVDPSIHSNEEIDEEDLVAMSKSMSHVESSQRDGHRHGRWATQAQSPEIDTTRVGLDWMQETESHKRTVIVEVRRPINKYCLSDNLVNITVA